MTKLLDHAVTAARALTEEDQNALARVVLDEAKRLAIMEGVADADAGKFIPHEDMKAWAESLGTDNELPLPQCR